jgi:hypothetical protein
LAFSFTKKRFIDIYFLKIGGLSIFRPEEEEEEEEEGGEYLKSWKGRGNEQKNTCKT